MLIRKEADHEQCTRQTRRPPSCQPRDKPQLTVVRGIRTQRTSLADELAIHMFGHLNGNDFASDVHDVLDARVRPVS